MPHAFTEYYDSGTNFTRNIVLLLNFSFQDRFCCFLFRITKRNNIKDVKIKVVCFEAFADGNFLIIDLLISGFSDRFSGFEKRFCGYIFSNFELKVICFYGAYLYQNKLACLLLLNNFLARTR